MLILKPRWLAFTRQTYPVFAKCQSGMKQAGGVPDYSFYIALNIKIILQITELEDGIQKASPSSQMFILLNGKYDSELRPV